MEKPRQSYDYESFLMRRQERESEDEGEEYAATYWQMVNGK